jgi:hypothetical protein
VSQSLVARLRKNRELKVEVGKFKFIAMRLTDVEALDVHRRNADLSELAQRFVIGWENVVEDDIVGGGVMTAVPFDAETWAEWCAERTDFWTPNGSAILDAYKLHRDRLKDAGKN